MLKGKSFNLIIGLIIFVLIVGIKVGSVYAKIGDNPIKKQNLYTYQDNHYGAHIRTDCRPGYTQVTSTEGIYNGCYKAVVYHISGYRKNDYYRICEEKNSGKSIYVSTLYRAVGPEVVRRYHKGTVSITSDEDSGISERYMRTVYSSSLKK